MNNAEMNNAETNDTNGHRKPFTTIDLTRGLMGLKLFFVVTPLVVSTILLFAPRLVDSFVLGLQSANDMLAVSVIDLIVATVILLTAGIAVAGATLIAQWTGANKSEQASFVAAQMLILALCIAILLTTSAYIGRSTLMELLGAKSLLVDSSNIYIAVSIWSTPLAILVFSFQAIWRGAGDTIWPMLLMFVVLGLKMVLTPCLVFGWWQCPAIGTAGAGWATLLAYATGAVLSLLLLFIPFGALTIRPAQLIPHWVTQSKILKLALPATLDEAVRSLALILMPLIVAPLGTAALAAYGIVWQGIQLIDKISIAVGQGISIGVGQNLGANQCPRAGRSAWLGTLTHLTLFSLLGIATVNFAPAIMQLLSSNNELGVEATRVLSIAGWGFGLSGALRVIQGAFQGAGRTGYSLALSVLHQFGLRLLLAWVLTGPLGFGMIGLCWGIIAADALGFLIGVCWMKWGAWQQNLTRTI